MTPTFLSFQASAASCHVFSFGKPARWWSSPLKLEILEPLDLGPVPAAEDADREHVHDIVELVARAARRIRSADTHRPFVGALVVLGAGHLELMPELDYM